MGSGGAIYVYGRSTSYVILKESKIFSNVAQFRGGGLFCLSGNVTHVNMSYFSINKLKKMLKQCNFLGNQAFEGGSLYGTVYSLHFVYGASFFNETTKGYGKFLFSFLGSYSFQRWSSSGERIQCVGVILVECDSTYKT